MAGKGSISETILRPRLYTLIRVPTSLQKRKWPFNFFRTSDDFLKKLLFYTLRLPGIYILITLGIMFDFILHLPFMVICSVENLFRRRTR